MKYAEKEAKSGEVLKFKKAMNVKIFKEVMSNERY